MWAGVNRIGLAGTIAALLRHNDVAVMLVSVGHLHGNRTRIAA